MMAPKGSMMFVQACLGLCCWGVVASPTADAKDGRASAVFAEFAEEQLDEAAARIMLRDLAREDVLHAAINALQNDARFRTRPALRRFAYYALMQAQAAQDATGFRLLQEGLAEPDVRNLAITAFSTAPKEKHAVVAEALCALADAEDIERDRQELLRVLALMGAEVRCADKAEAAFETATLNLPTRMNAALVILNTAGVNEALDRFERADAVGRSSALLALARFAGSTNYSYDLPDEAARQAAEARIEQFVLASLVSESREVRASAVEVYVALLGWRMWEGDTPQTVTFNPRFAEALEVAAERETDSALQHKQRELAQALRAMATYDSAAKRWWTRKSRRGSAAPPGASEAPSP